MRLGNEWQDVECSVPIGGLRWHDPGRAGCQSQTGDWTHLTAVSGNNGQVGLATQTGLIDQ
jgi:hypothetical protein